jgi:hypothetical protein
MFGVQSFDLLLTMISFATASLQKHHFLLSAVSIKGSQGDLVPALLADNRCELVNRDRHQKAGQGEVAQTACWYAQSGQMDPGQ